MKLSRIILQHPLQPDASSVNAAFHCAKRNAHLLGNLFVFIAIGIHCKDFAVLARKRAYCCHYFSCINVRAVALAIEKHIVGYRNTACGSFTLINEDIVHDGCRPSFEIDVYRVAREAAKYLHRRLLQQVGGTHSVTRQG